MNEPDNILLQYMRKFDAKLDRFEGRITDLIYRVASMETKLAQVQTDLVSHMHRMDRMETDIDLIKRRLELDVPTH